MKLAVIAEYDPRFEPHVQTNAAISHSAASLELKIESQWLSTVDEELERLDKYDAAWFAPGSPYRDLQRTLNAIRFAREHDIPTLGTCGGFQHLVIEYARHVAAIPDAQHAEYDPYASRLIISRLACSLVGREMNISLRPGSVAAASYGAESTTERYYCNFGVNPEFVEQISAAGFAVVGTDDQGECRLMEAAQHRFFVGTLFVPQAKSQPGRPHPLINAFLLAAAGMRGVSSK